MTMKYKPRPSDRAARIKQLEDRIERLGQLLDEVWDIASDALGEKYVNNGAMPNARPTKYVAALHVIAEKAASAFGSLHVNECATVCPRSRESPSRVPSTSSGGACKPLLLSRKELAKLLDAMGREPLT